MRGLVPLWRRGHTQTNRKLIPGHSGGFQMLGRLEEMNDDLIERIASRRDDGTRRRGIRLESFRRFFAEPGVACKNGKAK